MTLKVGRNGQIFFPRLCTRLDIIIKTPRGVGVNATNESTPRPWSVRVRYGVTVGRGAPSRAPGYPGGDPTLHPLTLCLPQWSP
eukprot:2577738-Prymnesium_polylepis.1